MSETTQSTHAPVSVEAGFLKRTSRGREVTAKTYRYFGLTPPKHMPLQQDIFDNAEKDERTEH